MGKTNSYLIKGERGYILIDAGVKDKSDKIQKALQANNYDFKDIMLIIITHIHYDHVGSLSEIKKRSNAPVLVHQKAVSKLEQGYTAIPQGTGWFSGIISFLGNFIFSRQDQFMPIKPDIIIDEQYELAKFGINGKIIPAPGHTADSICVIVDNKYCFIGDTMFNILPKSVFPPFANDKKKLLESWNHIAELNCEKFFPGHGKEFSAVKFNKTYNKYLNP